MTISNRLSGIPLLLLSIAYGQDSNSPFSNPLPQGQIVSQGNQLAINGKPVFLYGTNITYTACFPEDPVKAADLLYRRGYNWVRLHHVDVLLRTGQKTVAELQRFVDALYNRGIRVSIDGLSQYSGYSKLSLYQGQNRVDYQNYVTSLKPILTHAGCFLFTLVNEGMTEVKNSSSVTRAPEFYTWGKSFVQSLGFTGQVGDGGDMNIDPPLFAPAARQQDIVLCHIYGTHPQGGKYRYESWAENGGFAGVSFWLQGLAQKPMVFQEAGCLPFAADRAVNELFLSSEAKKRCSGIAYFQSFSNGAQWRYEFSQVDDFSYTTDYPRLVARLGGALIAKYGDGPESDYYNGHSLNPPKRDANYRRVTPKVKVFVSREKATVIVSPSSKKRYVILADATMIRGYQSSTGADGWISTVARGGKQVGYWEGSFVDLGAEVSGCYRLDPWTLKQVGTMVKSGTGFMADRSCGIFEVNLR